MTREVFYEVSGLAIKSNLLLPELPPKQELAVNCVLEVLSAGPPLEDSAGLRWVFRDETKLNFAVCGEHYLLRFPHQADFFVSCAGNDIKCRPLPGIPDATIRHLFLDLVIPVILSRLEPLVLHASAIMMGKKAVAFIGTSGQGKSTLAARHGQIGHPLICDDYLVLREVAGGWMAIPSYPGVRLWPHTTEEMFATPPASSEVAHYTAKRRVSDSEVLPFTDAPSPVGCFYVLDDEAEVPPQEPVIERITARESFMKMVSSSFQLDISDKEFLKRQFATIRRLVGELPCFRLRYAREFGTLPAVCRTIANHQERLRDVHQNS
jgi:hypothetical protein